jgi:DNA-directed RNA polymerase specialized sigma24 family protein
MERVHSNVPEQTAAVKDEYRREMEQIRLRTDLLDGKDKVIMKMYLENGNSFLEIAEVAGISEFRVRRKILGLMDRLSDCVYIRCLRHREHFSPAELVLAKEHYLTGLSQRGIARQRRCTLYQVRTRLASISHRLQMLERGGSETEQQGGEQ